MTDEAFNEFISTIAGFMALYTWALLFVGIGISVSILLGGEMKALAAKIVTLTKPEERYSKKSIEGWMNTMYAAWRIGLGSLVPCFIIYSISRYLPESYLNEELVTIDNSQLMISQAFLLMQAIVFFALLAIKSRALVDCYSAMRLAKESGI